MVLKLKILTDTDSLLYGIQTETFHENFFKDKELFDFSNYPKDSKYYNNLVVGKMKVEICDVSIKGFVGLNFKMYTFIREEINKNVADDKLKFEDCKFFFLQ